MANIISSSKNEIYTKLLDIAEKYIDIENSDFLKSGLFGYMTESMAMMIRDSTFNKGMLYNESFLNTAIIPKSVYNWAKMFNIQVNKATPAYANIEIRIPKDVFGTYAKKPGAWGSKFNFKIDNERNIIILDKENPITAGDYFFSLEHSIVIEEDNDNFSVYYLDNTEEYESTNYQRLSTDYLVTTYETSSDGTENIVIEARAYQYKLTKITRQITTSSFLNKVHTFNFEDQFADAKLFYSQSSSGMKPIELRYSTIADDNSENDLKFAYYDLTDTNELQIIFKSGAGGFVPVANSSITLYLYTTKGSNVPSLYTGQATMKITDEDLRSLPVVISFNPTNIIGGADAPSLDKIKKTIIGELSARNTIVTENDLNNYFSILTGLVNSISDGRVKFVKKRDDILRRVFTAYILIRDGIDDRNGEISSDSSFISSCIPTNTIDAMIPISTNTSMIFPKFIKYNDIYRQTSRSDGDFYISPFYLYITLDPIKQVKYIYNIIDETKLLTFTDGSLSNGKYIIPSTVRVLRDIDSSGVAKKQYTLIFSFKSNVESVVSGTGDIILRTKNGTQVFKKSFTNISANNFISTKSSDGSYFTNTLKLTIDVDALKEFDFTSSSDYGSNIQLHDGSKSVAVPGEVQVELILKNIKTVGQEAVTSPDSSITFKTDEVIHLFRNLDDIMLSDIVLNYSNEGNNKYLTSVTVKGIPVVHSSYFNKISSSAEDNQTQFISKVFTYIDLLKENLNKLETSTFFDLKFYNTYGESLLYNTLNTNVELEMNIVLRDNYKSDDTLKKEIRSYIRRAIDASNEDESIRISSLSSLVTDSNTYGNYIDHIDFVSLNGTFSQYIKRNANNEVAYTPEWLNLDVETLEEMIKFS